MSLQRTIAACVLVLAVGVASARAQAPLPDTPPRFGMSWSADWLSDLPTGGNLFGLIETTQPEVIADRFASGGLSAGHATRLGGFLSSPRQTEYLAGDVDLSSPVDGTPMLFPDLAMWQQVKVATGLLPPDVNAPGLSVQLQPWTPAAAWSGSLEGSFAGDSTVSGGHGGIPAIARLVGWSRGSMAASGPVKADRLRVALGAAWSSASQFERNGAWQLDGRSRQAFAHAVFTPASGDEWRAFTVVQRARTPSALAVLGIAPGTEGLDAEHLQVTYRRRASGTRTLRAFAGMTQTNRVLDAVPTAFAVERLTAGPVPSLATAADRTERRWSLGWRSVPVSTAGRHTLTLGADVDLTSARQTRPYAGRIGEIVDGAAARVWEFSAGTDRSARGSGALAIWAHDRMPISPRVALEGSARVEWVRGRADGAGQGITWLSVQPQVALHWDIGTPLHLSFFTGVGRTPSRFTLDLLSVGDPGGLVATVRRWDAPLPITAPAASLGPVVARYGPGTGDDPAFAGIDPSLKRPHTDEFSFRLETRPRPGWRFGVGGIARRQASMVSVVNTGVGPEGYTSFTIPDANADLYGPADDQLLTIYNRRPETFGRDRYLLANSTEDPSTIGAILVTGEVSNDHVYTSIGGTASLSHASAGNRGFRAIENDQDALGELLTNPNAATYAHGRVFTERGYTIKWTTVLRMPKDVRLGVIARYQDGQPFSRLVIVPGLNQGTEIVQAYPNGMTKFTFTGTIDARLQKGFAVGGRKLDVFLDAYNLLDFHYEVEEDAVTGPSFRRTTFVQPPRAIHVGFRARF